MRVFLRENRPCYNNTVLYIDGLAQYCSISSVLAFLITDMIYVLQTVFWPLGDLNEIGISHCHANLSDWWIRYLLWNCPQMSAMGLYWWQVNSGSGNGLVPPGNKPLPKPMLTQIYVPIWHHQGVVSLMFCKLSKVISWKYTMPEITRTKFGLKFP